MAHPLAGLSPPAAFHSAPSPPPARSSPAAGSSSSAAAQAPLVQGTVSYSSDEDEAGDPRKRRGNPFSNTIQQIASPDAARRPKSEFPARQADFWRSVHAEADGLDGQMDERVIRQFIFDYGSPEQPSGCRGLLWKLLLGYLPWNRREWANTLKEKRAEYEKHVAELTNNPFAGMATPTSPQADSKSTSSSSGGGGGVTKQTLTFSKVSSFDDPLSTSSSTSSVWSGYYADNSIREEIEKDVRRTYSSFHFFNERVTPVLSTAEQVKKNDKEERLRMAKENERTGTSGGNYSGSGNGGQPVRNLFDQEHLAKATSAKDSTIPSIAKVECTPVQSRRPEEETHHDVIKRILFVYAKLNPAIRYVQGMNELLAPVYYVFAHNGADFRTIDRSTGEAASDSFSRESTSALFPPHTAEADAFFCFTAIMDAMRDRFIKSLDLAPTGVLSVIANLNGLLSKVDYALWSHLNSISVDPRFYSFRWLTLMLSQEFELPDVMRLWDALFAGEKEAHHPLGGPAEAVKPIVPAAQTTAVSKGGLDFTDASPTASSSSSSSAAKKPTTGTRGRGPVAPTVEAQSLSTPKLIVEFLNDVCCAMLVLSREALLDADFATALKLLQSSGQGLDIQRLLVKAQEIRRTRHHHIAQAAMAQQQQRLPAPLTVKEHSQSFTTPVPRPGEVPGAPKDGRPIHIALLNAEKLPSLQVLPAAQQQLGGNQRLQPPPMQPSPALSDDSLPDTASTSTSSVSSSVQHVLSSASDTAHALADNVHALALSTAAAAKPLVKAGLESAKDIGKQAIHTAQQLAAGPAQTPTPKDVRLNTTVAPAGPNNLFPDSP